jgi:hypothetical protein
MKLHYFALSLLIGCSASPANNDSTTADSLTVSDGNQIVSNDATVVDENTEITEHADESFSEGQRHWIVPGT